jgi:hypothetical protein
VSTAALGLRWTKAKLSSRPIVCRMDAGGAAGRHDRRKARESADLRRPCCGQFGLAAHQLVSHCAKKCAALRSRHSRPRPLVEGLARGGDGAVHVGCHALGNSTDNGLAVRADQLDRVVTARFDPLAADEKLVGMTDLDALGCHRLLLESARCRLDTGDLSGY